MVTPIVLETVLNIEQVAVLDCIENEARLALGAKNRDFWGFIYVDRGKAGIISGNTQRILKEGEIIFRSPKERHIMQADAAAAKVIIASFACRDKAIDFFRGKILRLDTVQRSILPLILKKAAEVFSEVQNAKTAKKKNAPFGSGQLARAYLEQFLISLIQFDLSDAKKTGAVGKNENEDKIIEAIIRYLKSNITKQLSLDVICKDICFSKSYIKQLFSRKKGGGIMQFFISLKIDESKRLIEEGSLNITQISEILGFSSVHYFSRVFKNKTGMPPGAYSKKVNKNSLL